MELRAPKTVSAIVLAGLLSAGSSAFTQTAQTPPAAPDAQLLAADQSMASTEAAAANATVGIVPPAAVAVRAPHAFGESGDAFAGALPLPGMGGVAGLGIPQIVLAAYRNAELALASSDPGCHLPWNLLAGIGKVESNHANGGQTDANGTTIGQINGPALDGTLPGNEVLASKDAKGKVTYTKAIGPMQFLPSTWKAYQSDGNGDGVADPNNVFDASLAAGKYLCSGGMDLSDPNQELRAILRYNNSVKYANDVRRWSNAYRTGAVPSAVDLTGLIDPKTIDEMASASETTTTAATTTATAACTGSLLCPPPGVSAPPPPAWWGPKPAAPAPAGPPVIVPPKK